MLPRIKVCLCQHQCGKLLRRRVACHALLSPYGSRRWHSWWANPKSRCACCFSKARCPCTFNLFLTSYSPSLISAFVFFLKEFFQLSLMFRITVPISYLQVPSGQLSFNTYKVLHKTVPSDKLSTSTSLSKTKPLLPQKQEHNLLCQEQNRSYLKFYHSSSNRDWGMYCSTAS